MKHISLAAQYRPQRFEDIAGQDMIRAVLSRAAAESRVASGYLFCGTRGVGKTTAARIFAKALNCEHAPTAEPCNECPSCKKITAGIHPDVIEIDGASNNSVDDARALRETIGFAPMEGRYKVFIVDEAHMLSKSAFNALLKTLEEPPKHATFIFATTEIHKFPATILSRCQVYSFRHVQEATLIGHLTKVLGQEKIAYDEQALRLIARRAAGSVRDSMSLLDQVLAYDPETLSVEHVRKVLGLAGADAFEALFEALSESDCLKAAAFSQSLASSEVDLGFFIRELGSNLRSLFLLSQCSDKSMLRQFGAMDDEIEFWSRMAAKFSPGYLHAAWQMVVQNQRAITTNQEPAAALELLLLNLALLPRLLSSSHAAEPSVLSQSIAATAPGRPEPQREAAFAAPQSAQNLSGQAEQSPPSRYMSNGLESQSMHPQGGAESRMPREPRPRSPRTAENAAEGDPRDATEPPPAQAQEPAPGAKPYLERRNAPAGPARDVRAYEGSPDGRGYARAESFGQDGFDDLGPQPYEEISVPSGPARDVLIYEGPSDGRGYAPAESFGQDGFDGPGAQPYIEETSVPSGPARDVRAYEGSPDGGGYATAENFVQDAFDAQNDYAAQDGYDIYDEYGTEDYGYGEQTSSGGRGYSRAAQKNGRPRLSIAELQKHWGEACNRASEEVFNSSRYRTELMNDFLHPASLSSGWLTVLNDAPGILEEDLEKMQRGLSVYIYETYRSKISVAIKLSAAGQLQKRASSLPPDSRSVPEFQPLYKILNPACIYASKNSDALNSMMAAIPEKSPM